MSTKQNNQSKKEANANRLYKVSKKDLPICCPMPDMDIWNSHPKVYIPLGDDNKEDMCPYCSAKFELK